MRKRVILVFVLIAALLAASSCSLIVKDEEVDRQTTIIEVAGKTFTKEEVNVQVENTLDYQEYLYSMYGLSFDRTSADSISSAQDSAIQGLVQQAVLESKAAEMGLDTLSDEERAQVEETAETTYNGYVETVTNAYFADTELTGEELDKAIAEQMTSLGYPTKEALVESETRTAVLTKLENEVVKDVTVSEDELAQAYATHVEEAKTNYESSPSTYGTDVQNGTTIYYVPAGYRYVKNILIPFTEADQTAISDLQSQITAKQSELSTAQTSLTDLGEDASQDDENTAQNRATLTETVTRLNGEIADLQTQLDAAKEKGYVNIQSTAEEVLAKLAAGEDFDALMEQYGQDTGMQQSPAKENGYPVSADSTNWVTEFTEASMALANVGDVSQGVRTDYGIHILKYVSDAQEGETGLESVRDALQSELLTQKQDEYYNTTVEQWVEEAQAKTYKDRLN